MDLTVYASLCPSGTEHAAVYRLLAHALRLEYGLSELPEIARAPGGKPYFTACPDLCFNLSHSHGGIVCALHHKPVGIDIEKLRTAPRRLSAGMDDEVFFRLWTAREATIKRVGKGVTELLRPFDPDPLCQTLDGLLEGYIVTVCPSEPTDVRTVRIEEVI